MTSSQPTNASEWQLYKVLQRANLLQYYDTFVAQGGDDVQQLCEAGEEEFLEIMALVGMASKPLHVRRLQKALQEWVANPAAFQPSGSNASLTAPMREPPTHVYSLPIPSTDLSSSSSGWSIQCAPQKSVSPVSMVASNRAIDLQTEMQIKKQTSSSPQPTPVLLESQIQEIASCAEKLAANIPYFEAKPLNMKKDINKQIYELIAEPKNNPNRMDAMRKYGAIYRRFDSARAYEKPMSLHEEVITMDGEDPDRLEQCRKLGAIYGRFDSNRKKDKPMSMHEICVNEAAAQLCFHMPNLLTRREDLFPLARQVVKDSGYQYSKGHSRAADVCPTNPSKRPKLDTLADSVISGMTRLEREDRLVAIGKELSEISDHQERIVCELDNAKEGRDADKIEVLQTSLEQITTKHLQLLTEQSDLLRKQSYEMYGDLDADSDKDDSNLGNSGTPSPAAPQTEKAEAGNNTSAVAKAVTSSVKIGNMTQGMKNSLFDEGLRIAQQYGLGDFAQELQTLKGTDEEEVDSANHVNSGTRKVSNSVIGTRIGMEMRSKGRSRKPKFVEILVDGARQGDRELNSENGVQEEETISEQQEKVVVGV